MPYTTNLDEFLTEQRRRLPKYYSANKNKLTGFENREGFSDWYLHQLYNENAACHYCNTSILQIRGLLNSGIISGRAVGGGGIRGANLEIDRMWPEEQYSEENCVLSCYYCNNDKSDTFDYEIYKYRIGRLRKAIWEELLRDLR